VQDIISPFQNSWGLLFCALHGSCFELPNSCFDVLHKNKKFDIFCKLLVRLEPTTIGNQGLVNTISQFIFA